MKNKKKLALIAGISAAVLLAAAGLFWLFGGMGASGQKVYVQSVSQILGIGALGAQNRYAGIVEAQQTLKLELDSSKTLLDVFVQEGDEVKMGDPLFSYDVDALKLNLEQLQLDLENTKNSIATMNRQIAALNEEKANAPKDEQLQYTIQIQTLEVNIMQAEYDIKTKNNEIAKAQNDIEHAVVTAEMDGVVHRINRSGSEQPSVDGSQDNSFMTIMATGSFRVKGQVNEQLISGIYEGMPVIIRSRTDADAVWKGSISLIDLDNPAMGTGGAMYGNAVDDTVSSSKYPFYIELESSENLMVGQHVYIEPDVGQESQKDGVWLPGYYLVQEEEEVFIFAANGRDKIEKRKVQVGQYDADSDSYEILEGLSLEDRIAFPEDWIKAGMDTTDSPNYGQEEETGDLDTLPEGDLQPEAPNGGQIGIQPRAMEESQQAVSLEE